MKSIPKNRPDLSETVLVLALAFLWNGAVYLGARQIAQSWHHYDMTTSIDRLVPFLPWTVSIYLGCYLFWCINYYLCAVQDKPERNRFFCADVLAKGICFVLFLLIPTTNTRPEIIGDTVWDTLMKMLYRLDTADNLFPSIHCLVSGLCWIGVRNRKEIPMMYRHFSLILAMAVCISTLTTRQHVIFDIAGGVSLAEGCWYAAANPKICAIYQMMISKPAKSSIHFKSKGEPSMRNTLKIRTLCVIGLILAIGLQAIWFAYKNHYLDRGPDTATEEQLPSNQPQYIDAVSYEMELTLDAVNNTLTEQVSIGIKNLTEHPVSELCIRDMTPVILKYCEENYGEDNQDLTTQIISISVQGDNTQLEYNYGEDQSIIYVQLGEANTIPCNETASIIIQMKTDIPNRGDRFGYRETPDGKLYALSFCFPYLADNENGKWCTDPYFDDGESRSYDLADYSVVFHAPESYLVAMTGTESTENGTTTGRAECVRDFAIVACDFMKKDTFEVEGIKINNYYLNGKYSDTYRKVSNAVAQDSITIFTQQIGPYPYKELDIVPCLFGFAYGGMEYPGLVMSNASSFYDGPFCDVWSLEEKISHEIAHQWFYSAVGNSEYREGWLDEGFATLLEKDVYSLTPCAAHECVGELEEYYPSLEKKKETRTELIEYARQDYADIYLNADPDAYIEDQNYITVAYDASYAFLQEVRIRLGDERFMDLIREYYATYSMKTARTQDVLNLIRTYDNSPDMKEIINFYFK